MDDPALLLAWERLTGQILDRTMDFPKAVRFTFSSRIDSLALDILASLTRARWAAVAEKRRHLLAANEHLAVLRTMVRLSHERGYLKTPHLPVLAEGLDDAGRQLGGWLRALGEP